MAGEMGWNGWNPPYAHLMDDEQGGQGHMGIFNVEGDGFAVEPLEIGTTSVVDEHKLATLFMNAINTLARRRRQTHVRKETYEEIVSLEQRKMVSTHEKLIGRFPLRKPFSLRRDPIAAIQTVPLRRVSLRVT